MADALDALDEEESKRLLAEIEQAMRSRMHTIRLTDRLQKFYFLATRRQRSRIARAWFLAVVAINLLTIGIDAILHPPVLGLSLAMRAGFIPLVYGILIGVWLRPRRAWIEGATLPLAVAAMMVVAGVISRRAGFPGNDYLLAGLFGISTGVVVIPVGVAWTILGAAVAIGSFTLHGALGPAPCIRTLMFSLYCAAVVGALVPARAGLNAVIQHAFLLRLKSSIQSRALAAANARLAVQASTDTLTGLANRRGFDEAANRLLRADAGLPSRRLGIVIADIDFFKRLNDTAGHPAGDRCLEAVAGAIRACIPKGGLAARYGGEEFICLLVDPTPGTLQRLAEGLRAGVEALGWANPGLGPGATVTVSVGIALAARDGGTAGLADLIAAADSALYRAKADGRNRVVAAWEGGARGAADRGAARLPAAVPAAVPATRAS
ncbi:sensor domain-containing diguanylate cyclase [Methylobacterium crusticola]|uniref:GGDEF domain-containing protein n=1 Tax=Methylobacterium crusticola TaxID=1697972 RepID=UPI000FFCC1BC|nr:GGDEF domain-containing protein [Methylobacterium crusticola]